MKFFDQLLATRDQIAPQLPRRPPGIQYLVNHPLLLCRTDVANRDLRPTPWIWNSSLMNGVDDAVFYGHSPSGLGGQLAKTRGLRHRKLALLTICFCFIFLFLLTKATPALQTIRRYTSIMSTRTTQTHKIRMSEAGPVEQRRKLFLQYRRAMKSHILGIQVASFLELSNYIF
ncbi:hypothetical protein PAAG_04656 [Paracoccidioides lutzii Pb01]|uniref:Uncharacterized protein n=1 Tax=Paracoccidioides lutzii (strain ATCC MYA-826 / Pb01) TaxID=502779 RepID=C1H1L2_PARBA|nr:hypothetical protein PAAG_04656 [Paracoccidioides lutzii Pb01]EEH33606.1 hypothetical protein PAAG_04656 [Paracoccidioides lutzii Pb01]